MVFLTLRWNYSPLKEKAVPCRAAFVCVKCQLLFILKENFDHSEKNLTLFSFFRFGIQVVGLLSHVSLHHKCHQEK